MAINNIPDFTDETDANQYIEENAAELRLIFSDQVLVNVNAGNRLIDRLAIKGATNQEIIDNLVMDFSQGGPVFSGLKQQFKETGRKFGNEAESDGYDFTYRQELKNKGIDPGNRKQMWVSVLGKGTCETCFKMHGTIKTADEWIGQGPHEIFTECGQYCKCELSDVSTIENDLDINTVSELKRIAKAEKKDWTESLKTNTIPITMTNRAQRRDYEKARDNKYHGGITQALGTKRAETRFLKGNSKDNIDKNRRKVGL